LKKEKNQDGGEERGRGRPVLRPVEVPPTERLTPELVQEIEDDARLVAVAAVARRYVPAEENGEEEDTEDEE
jgi:hypothetical protein